MIASGRKAFLLGIERTVYTRLTKQRMRKPNLGAFNMKTWRVCALLISLWICAIARGQTSATNITVTGTLTRVMAIGGESTGWAIQFDNQTPVQGKQVSSIEVKFNDPTLAEKYVNKRVKAKGR